MSTKLPFEVAKEVKKVVYEAADTADYLAMSRPDSGKFLDSLVIRDDVGGVIEKFVKKPKVRHYIKDAILNRYSKDKAKEAKPDELTSIIKNIYNLDCEESYTEERLSLFRVTTGSRENEYVVVTDGTVLKWETALRKALFFIAGSPFSKNAKHTHILLMLYARHRKLTPSDKSHLEKALAISSAVPFVFGEQ